MAVASTLDPITAEVLAAALAGIVQEQESLFRTSFFSFLARPQ